MRVIFYGTIFGLLCLAAGYSIGYRDAVENMTVQWACSTEPTRKAPAPAARGDFPPVEWGYTPFPNKG